MTTPNDIHPIVMKVLDELSEKYFIHTRPTIKKSDNLELGWGGKGGRKTTINFTFITERPERPEIERDVKGIHGLRFLQPSGVGRHEKLTPPP